VTLGAAQIAPSLPINRKPVLALDFFVPVIRAFDACVTLKAAAHMLELLLT
jgi:hypothetical protein